MNQTPDQGEFEQARKKLVRDTQLATIAQLSRRIGHELRNPLAIVRNAAYLLKRKVPLEEAKWHEYFNIIEQAAVAADHILAELAAVSKTSRPTRKPVDLGQVIAGAWSSVSAPKTVGWRFTCEPEPLLLNLDAAQWEQLFRRVFLNSLEAMDNEGEVALRAERAADGRVEILVTDTGPGIAPDIRPLVFDPLFSTKPRAMGLGLTLAQQIVEQHGGTIEAVDTSPGAALRIRLPGTEDGA